MNHSLYIEKILTDALGLELSSMGKGFLERTLAGLLKKSGSSSLEEYVGCLKSSPGEIEKIIEAVVVPETWFFRDHGPFDYLRHYLPERGKQKTGKEKTRILSVPCSTGEEPYSIVMTLLEAGMAPEEFAVDAVDLSENALRVARGGRYGKGSFRGVTGEMGRRYFHQEVGEVRISQQVISMVRFFRDNLLQPASMAQMPTYQVIFCRNLLIYLHTKAKETAFYHIDRMLRPGGVLIAGHAEALFWRQRGYLLVDHPRSFALKKPLGKGERSCISPSLRLPGRREIHPRREAEGLRSLGTVGTPPAVIAPARDFVNDASPTEVLIQARSLADRGEMEEALSLCRNYLEKDQPCAEAYYLMGLIHESRECAGEAEECYLKALYLDPDHLETVIHAGLMYERRHDHKKANLFKNRLTRLERQRQPHPPPDLPLQGRGQEGDGVGSDISMNPMIYEGISGEK